MIQLQLFFPHPPTHSLTHPISFTVQCMYMQYIGP